MINVTAVGPYPLCSTMLAVIIFGVLQSCERWCLRALHAVQMLSGYEGPFRSTLSSTQLSLVSSVCVTLLHIVHYLSPAPCCRPYRF